jgi:hypothetical protein
VAGAALIYAIGYSIAAFTSKTWFGGVARVNVFAALCLIGVLGLALTPVLSPYRLAANSQYQLVLAGRYESTGGVFRNASPFQYLRFNAGAYGRRRLVQLAQLQNHADAARIQELANSALRASSPWDAGPTRTDDELISRLRVFPAGRTLDAELTQALRADLHGPSNTAGCLPGQGQELVGLFVDLKGDGDTEFILWNMCRGVLYQRDGGHWQMAGTLVAANSFARGVDLVPQLSMGRVTIVKRPWQDLVVGKYRFQVLPNQEAAVITPTLSP